MERKGVILKEKAASNKIALGLLILTGLALLVGILNAAVTQIAKSDSAMKGGKSSGVFSVLDSGGIKRNHLVLIDLSGPIMMDGGSRGGLFSEDSPAVAARKALDAAVKDDSVKGVLLQINSPGGTVGMSQELNAAVKRVREKKPVVVSMGDMAASGGYYTACAADEIISNPGTLTASIGVIISTMNLKGLLTDKLGVKSTTVKSGRFKDILSPYRDPSPEELALVQGIIDDSYGDFLNEVIDGRTRFITDEAEKAERIQKLKEVADGRVVTGNEALKAGLVDHVGDLYFARKRLDKIAKERFSLRGKDDLPIKEYSESGGLLQLLGMSESLPWRTYSQGQVLDHVVPMSMRYPNQPLWVLE